MKTRKSVVAWSILCGSLVMGCNAAIDATPGLPLPADHGSGGMGGMAGGGGQGGANGNGGSGGDAGKGEEATLNLAFCILDKAGPTGTCDADNVIKFGSVTPGMDVTRFGRIENKSTEDTTIVSSAIEGLGADLKDAFDVTFVRYQEDPVMPGVFQKIPIPLATILAPGEMLFMELKLTAPLVPGPLPDIKLVMATQFAGMPAPDLSVPIQGEISNCASGTGDCDGSDQTVCETDLLTSVDHCGMCGNTCNQATGTATCSNGACEVTSCNTGFANCNMNAADGCEVNTTNNENNCGTCGNVCITPNATPACTMSACVIKECFPNYYDVDKVVANGCECHKTSSIDLPDDGFVDANCDGIDGTESAAIFVAPAAEGGNDANPGTKTLPVASVIKAIEKATAGGKTQILVSEGIYSGRVTLVNGISIFGGYKKSAGWKRLSTHSKPIIESTADQNGRRSAVEGYDLTSTTILDSLSIRTTSTSAVGVSNYAMYCKNCGGLTLKNSDLVAGNAGPGANGTAGGNGAVGTAGGQGGAGSCGDSPGTGGSAGGSSCGRIGGAGGNGGPKKENGFAGFPGFGGTPGGAAGAKGNPGQDGGPGGVGNSGSAGANGAGGSGGNLNASFFWTGMAGAVGVNGMHGNGGGGGGGGGGENVLVNNGGGNGGGGGGGGGCGAIGGTGGTAGGGSFGLFVVNTTGAILLNSTIKSGIGGAGGSGAIGGIGGAAGQGGLGNTNCDVDVGVGGNGGAGGNGGNAGHGAGGAGGPSYAIYKYMSSVSPTGTTLTHGGGGLGGNSSGNVGANGASAATN